jgi:hypothetical protein
METVACSCAVVANKVAHLAHRLRELRIGLVKRDSGIRLIELHQRLSGRDELRVVRTDGDHGA